MAKSPAKDDDDLRTEKEKAKPDPVGKAKEPEKAKTIEEHGVGASDPYPTGSPRDPEDDFEAAHGFRREKPKE